MRRLVRTAVICLSALFRRSHDLESIPGRKPPHWRGSRRKWRRGD